MRSHWHVVAVAVATLLCEPASAASDEFTERVLGVFTRAAPTLQAQTKGIRQIEIQSQSGRLEIYLDNLEAACRSAPERCEAEIKSFVHRIAEHSAAAKDVGLFRAEKVYVVLRGEGFASRAGAEFRNEPKKQLVSRPFVGGIERIYVLDTPKAFRFVNFEDIEEAGLSPERLDQIAVSNAFSLKPVQYAPIRGEPDIYLLAAGDGLGTSRIFEASLWNRIEKELGGPVAVAAPTRDWIVFVKRDNAAAVEKLKALAGRIVRGEPYPVSPVVFVRDGASWDAY